MTCLKGPASISSTGWMKVENTGLALTWLTVFAPRLILFTSFRVAIFIFTIQKSALSCPESHILNKYRNSTSAETGWKRQSWSLGYTVVKQWECLYRLCQPQTSYLPNCCTKWLKRDVTNATLLTTVRQARFFFFFFFFCTVTCNECDLRVPNTWPPSYEAIFLHNWHTLWRSDTGNETNDWWAMSDSQPQTTAVRWHEGEENAYFHPFAQMVPGPWHASDADLPGHRVRAGPLLSPIHGGSDQSWMPRRQSTRNFYPGWDVQIVRQLSVWFFDYDWRMPQKRQIHPRRRPNQKKSERVCLQEDVPTGRWSVRARVG